MSYSIEELEALGITEPRQETPDVKAAREEIQESVNFQAMTLALERVSQSMQKLMHSFIATARIFEELRSTLPASPVMAVYDWLGRQESPELFTQREN